MERKRAPTDADYRRLLEFRTNLRAFLHWSEEEAHAAGLTPAQHQLLLAIRGHANHRGPTMTDIAESLMLRHNSVVGLVDRAVEAGLVARQPDADDHRVVRLRVTSLGARKLRTLSEVHLEELRRLAPSIRGLG